MKCQLESPRTFLNRRESGFLFLSLLLSLSPPLSHTHTHTYIYIWGKIRFGKTDRMWKNKWINRNIDHGFKNDISSLFQKDFIRMTKFFLKFCYQCLGLSTFPHIFSNIYKLADCRRGRPDDSLFNRYYTESTTPFPGRLHLHLIRTL